MKLFRQFRTFCKKGKLDAEMSDEMRLHLELQAAENERRGMAPDDARYAAQRAFGGVEQIKERARDQRGFLWLDQLVRDVRFAVRSLRKSPGFTSVALVTLALGIGVNTTAFSALNTLLLHQLPYPRPEQLVRLYATSPDSAGGTSRYHAPANFYDQREQNNVFAAMAAWQGPTSFNLADAGEPASRVPGLLVTADFFSLVGLAPELGRTFTPDEDRPGNNGVVILSHAMWLDRFGAAPDIVGRKVRINGEPVTVVGVMPPAIADVLLWNEIALWRPMALSDQARQDRNNNTLNVAARLKRGVTLRQAQSAMSAIARQLASAYPQFNAQSGLQLVPLAASTQDATGRGITWLLMGLAGFVLLIACANLANLQFARNAARMREHAIRSALGASRAQLLRHVLTESMLLSLAGGVLALFLAVWSTDLIGRFFVWGDHVGLAIPVDRRVLAFTVFVSLLTGIAFGVLPAWLSARVPVGDAMTQGARGATSGRATHRVRHALIVTEVALALVLLSGAGFFIRGLQRYTQRDPGWRPEGLLTAYVSLKGPTYATAAARETYFRQLQERLAGLPGVERATIGSSLPTFGFNNVNSFVVANQPEPAPGRAPNAAAADVMPGYFETLGVRLLQGRDFTARDNERAPHVVIINESMARKFWPGENPVGQRIGGAVPFMKEPREIIGVVSDARSLAALGLADGRLQMYRPLAQRPPTLAAIALRTRVTPESVAPDLRRLAAGLDPDVAVFGFSTVALEADRGLASIAAAGWVLVSFAGLGVLLAAVGIYGVIANTVAQRTNEIGIRMALGAQVRNVFALILGGGLRLTLLGAAIGLLGVAGVARLLPAISPEFGGASVGFTTAITFLLIGVAAVACWLPARRATKVDPMIALRAE
jgi:predicted permease